MTFQFSYLKDATTSWLLFAYSGNNEPIVHRTSYSELLNQMETNWVRIIVSKKRLRLLQRKFNPHWGGLIGDLNGRNKVNILKCSSQIQQ
jgi:hypothetical protein